MKKIVALVLSLVMVLGLATTAFAAADTYDFYAADKDLADKLAVTDAIDRYTGVEIDAYAAKANTDGSGNVAYLMANNNYFVKTTTPTVADFAVTAHGKSTVLYYVTKVTAADVVYEATAVAFDDFGTTCGKLYNVDKTAVYYEITAAALTSAFEADDVVFAVSTADPNYQGTAINVLVGDVIKTVDSQAVATVSTLTPDAILTHNWAVTGVVYSATLGMNVPTEAKCLNCGAVVDKFYFTADKVPAGEDGTALPAPFGTWYIVEPEAGAATTTPDASTGDKVESAETFDAGIAMYVGMSVMAAAGSAVVLKKKD